MKCSKNFHLLGSEASIPIKPSKAMVGDVDSKHYLEAANISLRLNNTPLLHMSIT